MTLKWVKVTKTVTCLKSRYPQKLTQLSPRSHPRHLVGKRTAQNDTIIDTTSDSQVNSNFPYRWLPAGLTFYTYFSYVLYSYITRITINNNTPLLKLKKKQKKKKTKKQKSRLWTASDEITGGLELVCGRPTLALGSALVHLTNQLRTTKTD